MNTSYTPHYEVKWSVPIFFTSCDNVSWAYVDSKVPYQPADLLTESVNATKCMNGERRPAWYFGHMQDVLNLRILHIITISTRLYNFDPLKPHFYIVKLGFTGGYIIFLISD